MTAETTASFPSSLREGKILLFDGAFGTYYSSLTGRENRYDYANLDDPEMVERIHREYIQAGAMAIKTNTFSANSSLYRDFGTVREIIRAGFAIAQKAAGEKVLVFADIGPCHSEDSLSCREEYRRIIDVFLSCGARYFLFETFPESQLLLEAVKYLKTQRPDAFVVASFAVSPDGYTSQGVYIKDLAEEVKADPHLDAYGFNCICGPTHLGENLDKIAIDGRLLSAMPNAGYPSYTGGRVVYVDNEDYFSERAEAMVQKGVRIVGGCCGTTPSHIAALAKRLGHTAFSSAAKGDAPIHSKQEPLPPVRSNTLRNKFSSNHKIMVVELDPPFDTDFAPLLESARRIAEAGVDAISLADSPLARPRAENLMVAAKIKRETGLDVLPHMTCRDRNLISIKGGLLAAKMEDIHGIIAVTGDPVPETERRNVSSVFNFNSFHLIRYIHSLNQEDFSRDPFLIGGALNVNAANFQQELTRAKRKVESGASFLMTQPVMSGSAIENLRLAHESLDAKILMGIMPIAGHKNAVFLNNEVSGISIPPELIRSFEGKDKKESERIAIDFCLDIVRQAEAYCDGYFIITPLKRVRLVCRMIQQIRSLEI